MKAHYWMTVTEKGDGRTPTTWDVLSNAPELHRKRRDASADCDRGDGERVVMVEMAGIATFRFLDTGEVVTLDVLRRRAGRVSQ